MTSSSTFASTIYTSPLYAATRGIALKVYKLRTGSIGAATRFFSAERQTKQTRYWKIPATFCLVIDSDRVCSPLASLHQVEWLKNDEPLRSGAGERIETIGSYSGLKVHSINFADTGAYMCQASSIGGLARDISSLVVQDESTPSKLHSPPNI